jgi:hypothetical protein
MARSSIREELRRRLSEYLAVAETHQPEECPLDVRSVATALRISPTTLYKYDLNRDINAAERRQRENMWLSGAAIEQQFYTNRIRDLTAELQQERQRSKNLIARIATTEANAARLGFDPEELYKPILKPLRAVSRAGSGGKWHGRTPPGSA